LISTKTTRNHFPLISKRTRDLFLFYVLIHSKKTRNLFLFHFH
jgi:hypothetical protein